MIKFRIKKFSLPGYTSPIDQGLGGSKLSKDFDSPLIKQVSREVSYERLRNILPEEFFKVLELSKTVRGVNVQFPDAIQNIISKSGGEKIDNLIILDSQSSPGLGYNLKTRSWYSMSSGRKLINNDPVSFIRNVMTGIEKEENYDNT